MSSPPSTAGNITNQSVEAQVSLYPMYKFLFEAEKNFNAKDSIDFINHMLPVTYSILLLYLILVSRGPILMKDRKSLKMKPILFIWNASLAIFSLFAAFRTVPELWYTSQNFGFQFTICNRSFLEHKVCGFWSFLYVFSKLPELLDTLFIILRKRNLIFLHWFHHITILLYTWHTYEEQMAPSRWFGIMNCCIHSLMYFYYAFAILNIYPPKFVSILITSTQILQMLIGFFISVSTFILLGTGADCHISYSASGGGCLLFGSYIVLFSMYFYNSYLKKELKIKGQ